MASRDIPRENAPRPAALYHALHRGNPGDVDLYRRLCRGARSVLELGCGAGRVAHALAADGKDVVGIEGDDDSRALGEGGPANLAPGDMRAFELSRRFDRVIIPYCGLYCLLDEEALLSCLRCARAHLRPGGLFIFDGYAGDALHRAPYGSAGWDELERVARISAEGSTWHVYEQSFWDPARRRIDARYVYAPDGGGAAVESRIPQRYVLAGELPEVLSEAGLRLLALCGDFEGSAFDPDLSDMLVAIAGQSGDESAATTARALEVSPVDRGDASR